jgi:hypothetical protein
MLHLLQAGPDLVTCDLTAVEAFGPYRLSIRHANGVIIEYFHTVAAALERQAELENLLMAAQGFGRDVLSLSA